MLRDAQAEKAYADAAKSRAELAGWMPAAEASFTRLLIEEGPLTG